MPNQKNIDTVKELREKLSKAKSVVLADFKGLNANNTSAIRTQMRKQNAEMAVARNTLIKIALKEEKYDVKEAEEDLKGNTVAVISYDDPIAVLKPLVEFAKKFELPKIKSAFIDGRYTTAEQVEVISNLPSREQLLAQVVGTMKSPLSGFANVLAGSQRKFVYAIKAVADSKK
jgi:large subunit ribosomal protein L10